MRPKRAAFAVGGTAGHGLPALAVATELREAAPSWSLLFVGTGAGFEGKLVPGAGFPLRLVPGAAFQRTSVVGKLRAIAVLPAGIVAARRLLEEEQIEIVVGFGGFATVPTLLAARSLGLKTAIHEANVDLGLANRRLAPLVDRVWFGVDLPDGLDGPRRLAIGTPVMPAIRALASRPLEPPPPDGIFHVLVLSGSDPSRFLDERLPSLLARVARQAGPISVRHQSGGPPERVRAAYASAGIAAEVSRFFDDVAEGLGDSGLVVTRAGGGALAELAVVGRPALLVPLAEAAESHQSRNASVFAERTGVWRVEESDWREEELAALVAGLRRDPVDWVRRATSVRAEWAAGAAARVAREILDLASR